MRLSDLLVEKKNREPTGMSSVDTLLENIGSNFPEKFDNLPVSISSSEWEILESPTRLARSFEFDNFKKLKYFINELISYQELKNHHSLININSNIITIETYTHDVNNVTNLDISLSKFCDEVYDDTRFFSK